VSSWHHLEIVESSGNAAVELLIADLSSQESIRQLARDYTARHDWLHVLVNNAGVYLTERQVTVDRIEMTLAVNYLARFLLINLLLDMIKRSAPARIVEVAGAYHKKGTIAFDNLQSEKAYNGAQANAQSKLANVLFTHELARRLEGTGVTVNCLHPGAARTGLVEKDPDYPSLLRFMYRLSKPFMKSPEKGAATSIYLASSPDVEGSTGKYFVNQKQAESSNESHDAELAHRLWDISSELTGLADQQQPLTGTA
jgi:NAD(P)-dependent dehydrogenase (short-subunit alcohol dehydrogenase family)